MPVEVAFPLGFVETRLASNCAIVRKYQLLKHGYGFIPVHVTAALGSRRHRGYSYSYYVL
eukprot:scaffold434391_cov20-Prasinocladus_malaysianus.AAC.1